MRVRWKNARFLRAPETIDSYADKILTRKKGDIPIQLLGTPWQIKVWQALLAIPEGKVTSYGALAAKICGPNAARATGTAVGRNPISLLIPCHRVLSGTGAITGYHWGLPRKRAMLALEAARSS
jgi:AraC family transcriptional regulator of adaptative response/methylated-DNA-[protein]-cysteine methyltransferase